SAPSPSYTTPCRIHVHESPEQDGVRGQCSRRVQKFLERDIVGPGEFDPVLEWRHLLANLSKPEALIGRSADDNDNLPGMGQDPEDVGEGCREIVRYRHNGVVFAKARKVDAALFDHRYDHGGRRKEPVSVPLYEVRSRCADANDEIRRMPGADRYQ